MSAKGRRLAYIADVERRSGFAPLTFIMARYLDAYNVRGLDDLKHVLNAKEMNGVGIGTLNELRKVAGIPVVGKSLTNKEVAQAWERCADSLIQYVENEQAAAAVAEYKRLKNKKRNEATA